MTAGVVVNSVSFNKAATNSPTRGYALSPSFARLIRSYGTLEWENALKELNEENLKLKEELERRRELERVPVKLPLGLSLKLSVGEHNELQKAIIEQFLPLYGMGAQVLYVGDTSDKFLYLEDKEYKHLFGKFYQKDRLTIRVGTSKVGKGSLMYFLKYISIPIFLCIFAF